MTRRSRLFFSSLLILGLLGILPIQSRAEDGIDVPMTVGSDGRILLDIKVEGKTITCMVDTGSPYFLIVPEDLADRFSLAKTPFPHHLVFPLHGFPDAGDTYLVRFNRLEI